MRGHHPQQAGGPRRTVMRVGGPQQAAARGPQGPDLDGCEGPSGSGPRRGAPALAGRDGFPLGRASLAWWLAPCGPLAAAPNGGARAQACSSGRRQDHGGGARA